MSNREEEINYLRDRINFILKVNRLLKNQDYLDIAKKIEEDNSKYLLSLKNSCPDKELLYTRVLRITERNNLFLEISSYVNQLPKLKEKWLKLTGKEFELL